MLDIHSVGFILFGMLSASVLLFTIDRDGDEEDDSSQDQFQDQQSL